MPDISLFLTPGWYLWDLDLDRKEGVFVHMDRSAYARSSFLDDRIQPAGHGQQRIALQYLWRRYRELDLIPQPVRYIFHTAFCCSTLLSRALDIPGRTLVYREPLPLDALSTLHRNPELAPGINRDTRSILLRLDQAMSARHYGDEIVIVKPNDACNNLIPELMAGHDDNRGLVMYSDLKAFLVATLKAPIRRQFIRQSLPRAKADAAGLPILSSANVEQLSDPEASAYVWLVQLQRLHRLLETCPTQLRSLDAEVFLSHPAQGIKSVSEHMGLMLEEHDINTIINGPTFHRYSKDTQTAYDAHSRAQQHAAALAECQHEIETGLRWAASLLGTDPSPWPLPAPV
jgi:hypothetical protein